MHFLCKFESFLLLLCFQHYSLETNIQLGAFGFRFWFWCWQYNNYFGNRIVFCQKNISFDNIIFFGNRIVLGQPERHLKLIAWAVRQLLLSLALSCLCIFIQSQSETFYTYSLAAWQSNPRESLPPNGEGRDFSIIHNWEVIDLGFVQSNWIHDLSIMSPSNSILILGEWLFWHINCYGFRAFQTKLRVDIWQHEMRWEVQYSKSYFQKWFLWLIQESWLTKKTKKQTKKYNLVLIFTALKFPAGRHVPHCLLICY